MNCTYDVLLKWWWHSVKKRLRSRFNVGTGEKLVNTECNCFLGSNADVKLAPETLICNLTETLKHALSLEEEWIQNTQLKDFTEDRRGVTVHITEKLKVIYIAIITDSWEIEWIKWGKRRSKVYVCCRNYLNWKMKYLGKMGYKDYKCATCIKMPVIYKSFIRTLKYSGALA